MRTFIAIDLDAAVREKLADMQDALRPKAGRLKWVAPGNIHLTLKFLGDTSAAQAEQVTQALAQLAAEIAPFDIRVEGLGVFGPRGPVRVVWAGITDSQGRLAALQRAVESRIAPLGFPSEDRSFSPHLTLARAGRDRPNPHLRELIARQPNFFGNTLHMDVITLYASMPGPKGLTYNPLGRFVLAMNKG